MSPEKSPHNTPETTNPFEGKWLEAANRVADVVKLFPNKYFEKDQEPERIEATLDALNNLALSESLKVVVTTLDQEGTQSKTIEPDWAESPGFGLPVGEFAFLMGLDEPGEYDRLSVESDWYLPSLSDVSDKEVSAIVDGVPVEPALPEAA